MNKQVILKILKNINGIEKSEEELQKAMSQMFDDFTGVFKQNSHHINFNIELIGSLFTDSSDVVDWVTWYLWDKPDGSSKVSIDSKDYLISSEDDFADFLLDNFSGLLDNP